MRDPVNIREVSELSPELMGFIFYSGSPRRADKILNPGVLEDLQPSIIKTGVFVNEAIGSIIRTVRKFNLNCVQLHGNETPELCMKLKDEGLCIIKSFSIKKNHNFKPCEDYILSTDYFLFDNSGSGYGGSGVKFDWTILDKYKFEHPFFLGGGISLSDSGILKEIKNPAFYGIDLNSRFETAPGLKDTGILRKFIEEIRQKD